jgi:hypothetical protein
VRGAPPTGVTVAVTCEERTLALTVESAAAELEATAIEDRVGALGGRLTTARLPAGGMQLVAELPCES